MRPSDQILRHDGIGMSLYVIPSATYGEHRRLKRRSEAYAREGVDLDVSTLDIYDGPAVLPRSPG